MENLSDNGSQVSQVAYGYRGGSNDLYSVTRKAGGVSQAVTLSYGKFPQGQKPGLVYSEKLDGATFLDYAYDALGRMTGKTVAGNQTYTYTYKNFLAKKNSATLFSDRVIFSQCVGNVYRWAKGWISR